MFNYQYMILIVLLALCFNRASFSSAIILSVAYVFYSNYIVDLSAVYYYACAALLNLCVGFVLHHKNIIAAICSYLLVMANSVGFFMWYMWLTPDLYNNFSAIILVIQLLAILPTGALNGSRAIDKYIMANPAFFNSNQSRVTMRKKHTKEAIK